MIDVEHVDFIGVSTQDVARSKHFYGEILGLPLEDDTPNGAEFRAGQVTIGFAFRDPDGNARILHRRYAP